MSPCLIDTNAKEAVADLCDAEINARPPHQVPERRRCRSSVLGPGCDRATFASVRQELSSVWPTHGNKVVNTVPEKLALPEAWSIAMYGESGIRALAPPNPLIFGHVTLP